MKRIFFSIFLLVMAASAQDKKSEKLVAKKAEVTEQLTRHIQAIEKAKVCVNGATDKKAVRACTKQLQNAMQMLKEQRKAAKREKKTKNKEEAIKRIDEKIKKLQEKKAELKMK